MRSFIISTVIGTAALAIYGVTGSTLPVNAVKRYDQTGPCYFLRGERHCLVSPQPNGKCWSTTEGIHCPLKARGICSEAPDGQVHCDPKDKSGNCWETPNGQIHCDKDKRDKVVEGNEQGPCSFHDDGKIQCGDLVVNKRETQGEHGINMAALTDKLTGKPTGKPLSNCRHAWLPNPHPGCEEDESCYRYTITCKRGDSNDVEVVAKRDAMADTGLEQRDPTP
ncbi:MAG: hypothetical protein Q9181_006566, partial [Wetmoreana brouardii]